MKNAAEVKMKTSLECLPCLGRNAVEAAKRSTPDPAVRKTIVSEALHFLAEADLSMPPPFLAGKLLSIARRHAGSKDLYSEEKKRSGLLAEKLLASLGEIPGYDPDGFESRLRLAVAGNILDFGVFGDLDIERALQTVRSVFAKPLDREAVKRLHERMESAQQILYVLDNCGEAVFDRVFMEPYRHKTVLAVRGCAVFNDVTENDLPDCGLAGFTRGVISSGAAPGLILSECDEKARRVYAGSDLIIAKGQGNFETMNEYPEPIAFLFLAKCPVVIRELQAEPNSIQIRTLNF